MVETKKKTEYEVRVVLAAGGNPTGIISFPNASRRNEYPTIAKKVMGANPDLEQFGFLEGNCHFQMSGGEFCGNAARAAALLIAKETRSAVGQFTMSGFAGIVSYRVLDKDEVECRFPGLTMTKNEVSVLGLVAEVVNLGGIVHVILPLNRPFDPAVEKYRKFHQAIVRNLRLDTRPAVGVIWREKRGDSSTKIHPVVWVRDIDSFFYETACGSGTLAVLAVSDADHENIVQPSGQSIYAEKRGGSTFVLRSQMEIQEQRRLVWSE